MGQDKPKLRLLRLEETCEDETIPKRETEEKPKTKSAIASQLSSFADELDKQIAQILAM